MIRKLKFYKRYFIDFYLKQNPKVQKKIEYVFKVVKQVERVPIKFFKYMQSTDGIYEIRVEYESNIYRIFCFYDDENLIVLINSFQKKTQKTPKKQIDLATRLKKQYFKEKKLNDGKT